MIEERIKQAAVEYRDEALEKLDYPSFIVVNLTTFQRIAFMQVL